MSKAKKVQVLSPDGITIDFNKPHYRSYKAAKTAFDEWAKRYEAQGYYSSASYGRIHLLDLIDYCSFKDLNATN